MTPSSEDLKIDHILKALDKLDSRISAIENRLQNEPNNKISEVEDDAILSLRLEKTSDEIELQIGEYWFAKVGIVILAIGIVFLLTFPLKNFPSSLPIITGYVLVGSLVVLSHLLRKSFSLISRYLLGGGLILLYFTTLRLRYFGDRPILEDQSIELILLLTVVGINLYVSLRRESIYLAIITLTLGYITAILCNQPIYLYGIISLLAIITVYIQTKYKWHYLFNYSIVLAYFTHFIWFINNPFQGNKIQFVDSPYFNIYFILFYALIFSTAIFFRSDDLKEDKNNTLNMFLISFGGYGLFLFVTLTKFQQHLALNHFIVFILFLTLSVILWKKELNKYATSFYAIIGYTALSIALISQFAIPDSFIWLSWQSLLVISTAIWFRSRFIIVANFLIYLIIFISYLYLAGTVNVVSLSFGVVALLSARILNFQKERLELKTEFMRISYLVSAFFMFPYALYNTVPEGYVGLAWVGIALFYYIISRLLHNNKYRWMALLTLLLSVGYIMIIGITQLEPGLRILSFVVIGLVFLTISLVYTKIKSKSSTTNNEALNSK